MSGHYGYTPTSAKVAVVGLCMSAVASSVLRDWTPIAAAIVATIFLAFYDEGKKTGEIKRCRLDERPISDGLRLSATSVGEVDRPEDGGQDRETTEERTDEADEEGEPDSQGDAGAPEDERECTRAH